MYGCKFGSGNFNDYLNLIGPELSEWKLVEGCQNICDDGSTSTWKRDCIDPSRGIILPMAHCSAAHEEDTIQLRPCVSPDFPECPCSLKHFKLSFSNRKFSLKLKTNFK